MSVHGYCRATPHDQVQSVAAQKSEILRYCQANALLRSDVDPPTPAEPYWYVDRSGSGKHMLRDRTAGGVLCRNLERGDAVVIARLDRAFRRLSDIVMLEDFRRRDIHLHVCDMLGHPVDVSRLATPAMLQILKTFGRLERSSRAERTGEASRDRRARGLGLGPPRLGFRYERRYTSGPDGRSRRHLRQVPDEQERAVMKMIVAWRREDPPRSWSRVRRDLDALKILTRSGTPWSTVRIRRAARAEVLLEAIESRGWDPIPVLARLSDLTPASVEERDPAGESG